MLFFIIILYCLFKNFLFNISFLSSFFLSSLFMTWVTLLELVRGGFPPPLIYLSTRFSIDCLKRLEQDLITHNNNSLNCSLKMILIQQQSIFVCHNMGGRLIFLLYFLDKMGHGEEEHFARVFVTHKPSFTLCLGIYHINMLWTWSI